MSETEEKVELTNKPLTEEGVFGYFDQMADRDGNITTTSKWLAEVGMLIVHECSKTNHFADSNTMVATDKDSSTFGSERLREAILAMSGKFAVITYGDTPYPAIHTTPEALRSLVTEADAIRAAGAALVLRECPMCGLPSFEISPINDSYGVCWNENTIYGLEQISDGIDKQTPDVGKDGDPGLREAAKAVIEVLERYWHEDSELVILGRDDIPEVEVLKAALAREQK